MFSNYNEGKSAVDERFIKILKNSIYYHMSSFSKNMSIDKLYAIVNKFNNIYHRTIKMNLLV